jgi:LPS-assembly protein
MFDNDENEPRLKGNKALSKKNETIVSKAIFTTCKKRPNNKCPPWIIQAEEARHDKIKKTIYYKNAWLKIYDVPVMYFPTFFHPDPTVKRQSGFLTPQIGESQILGSSAYIPYFYVISDSKDLTFKPRIFNNNKYSIQTEYRQVTKNTNSIFDFSLTQGHKSSQSVEEDSRSHFFSNSNVNLDFLSFDESNLEVQLQKTSNNTYLKLFNLESPLFGEGGSSDVSTLNSFINLTANSDDLDFNATVQVYEKLDSGNSDRYEFIFPNYSLNKNIETNKTLSGSLSFNSSGSQHLYNTNVKETEIINDLLYQSQDKFLTNGIKNNYNILLKNSNSDGRNSTKFKNEIQSEMLSLFIFESSYPLLREGLNFNNYLTPKLSLRYSPNSMKNLRSEDRRIDVNNIFSLNRIGYSGTVESGQSLTIGGEYLKSRKINDEEEKNEYPTDLLELSLATVFRDEVNENMPSTSSLGEKSSDIVGHIGLSPNNFFRSNYSFSLDNNLDVLKYNSLDAQFTVNNFITSFKYLEENDNVRDESYIQNNTSFKFNENSSFAFSIRKNKKIDLIEFYDLIYQYKNDCLTAAIKYKKDFYTDNDLKPTEQLFFSLTIVPLGAYETTNIIPK